MQRLTIQQCIAFDADEARLMEALIRLGFPSGDASLYLRLHRVAMNMQQDGRDEILKCLGAELFKVAEACFTDLSGGTHLTKEERETLQGYLAEYAQFDKSYTGR